MPLALNQDLRVKLAEARFAVTTVGSNQTTELIPVHKGTRVLWASVRVEVAGAGGQTATIELGDGGATNRFVTTTDLDPDAAVGTLANGSGAGFATSGGYLYLADDTIDMVYTANAATGARPVIIVKVAYVEELLT